MTLPLLLAPTFLLLTQEPRLPAPDPALQAEIRAAVQATTEEERRGALDALRALPGPDAVVLVPQLFHYTRGARTTRDAMAFGVLLEPLSIPRRAVLRGVVPFLEAGSEPVRRHAAGILAEYEDADPERGPDFSVYRSLIEVRARAGEPPPVGLTRHLFDTHPGAALLSFCAVWLDDHAARKPYLWAEHVLADLAWRERHGFDTHEVRGAVDVELEFLLTSESWWARLAGACYLERHPSLARAEWTERIRADAHPLVRERS